jgi:hypothetical protein
VGATNPNQPWGGKCGYIDANGTEVIPIQYEWAGGFFEDVAAAA